MTSRSARTNHALILPAVIPSRFLGDIRLDTVQNPVSRTGPFHVGTAGSISIRAHFESRNRSEVHLMGHTTEE